MSDAGLSDLTEATLRIKGASGARAHSGLRLPAAAMRALRLGPGDAVALRGAGLTHAIVRPGSGPAVEADPATLSNAGLVAGDLATVTPAHLSDAVRISFDQGTVEREVFDAMTDRPVTIGDCLVIGPKTARVTDLDPAPAAIMRTATQISSRPAPRPFPKIGGLAAQIASLREMVEMPLQRPDLFVRLGIRPPRGVLFTGPPGSGKTALARAVADATEARFFSIDGPEIISKHYGDSEARIREVFRKAEAEAPSILFIDEIDAIAPRRDGLSGEKQLERRVVAQLLTLMDGLSDRSNVVVIAATNLPHTIDMALRRPGRFDREIAFTPPDPEERRQILEVHTNDMPLAECADLGSIAAATHGYVGADLAALVREAGLAAVRRAAVPDGLERIEVDALKVTQLDLDAGMAATGPSALRIAEMEAPRTAWSDVGGLGRAKRTLAEAFLWPLKYPAAHRALGLDTVPGVLLAGPPGTGKTLLARAVATEAQLNFIPVRGARLLAQYLGEAERQFADLFARARHAAPCILFFDELDALAPSRRSTDPAMARVVAQLLTEIDGIEGSRGVALLGATNRIDAIDPALRRPGRFDLIVEVDLPDDADRLDILRVLTRALPLAAEVDLDTIAALLSGGTGADLAAVCRGAARCALRRHLANHEPDGVPQIRPDDFTEAAKAHLASGPLRTQTFQATGEPDLWESPTLPI
ncbi:MAG: AAA family ATPase [Paracoccaceae bacterium]